MEPWASVEARARATYPGLTDWQLLELKRRYFTRVAEEQNLDPETYTMLGARFLGPEGFRGLEPVGDPATATADVLGQYAPWVDYYTGAAQAAQDVGRNPGESWKDFVWTPYGTLPAPIAKALYAGTGGGLEAIANTAEAARVLKEETDAAQARIAGGLAQKVTGVIAPGSTLDQALAGVAEQPSPATGPPEILEALRQRGQELREGFGGTQAPSGVLDAMGNPINSLLWMTEQGGPTAAMMAPSVAAGALTGSPQVGAIVGTALESLGEAGGQLAEARVRGLSEADARKEVVRSFLGNAATLGVSNALETAVAFTPVGKIPGVGKALTAAVRKSPWLATLTTAAGKAFLDGFLEGQQELYQERISQFAETGKLSLDMLDPRAKTPQEKQAKLLGALYGAAFGSAGALAEAPTDVNKARAEKLAAALQEAEKTIAGAVQQPTTAVPQAAVPAASVEPVADWTIDPETGEMVPIQPEPSVAAAPEAAVGVPEAPAEPLANTAQTAQAVEPIATGVSGQTTTVPITNYSYTQAGVNDYGGVTDPSEQSVEVVRRDWKDRAAAVRQTGNVELADQMDAEADAIRLIPQEEHSPEERGLAAAVKKHLGYKVALITEGPNGVFNPDSPDTILIRRGAGPAEIMAGVALHEVTGHGMKVNDLEAHTALVETIRESFPEVWQQTSDAIRGKYEQLYTGRPAEEVAAIIDEETLARVSEDHAGLVWRAIAERSSVEQLAQQPRGLRRLVAWLERLGDKFAKAGLWKRPKGPRRRTAAQLALEIAGALESARGGKQTSETGAIHGVSAGAGTQGWVTTETQKTASESLPVETTATPRYATADIQPRDQAHARRYTREYYRSYPQNPQIRVRRNEADGSLTFVFKNELGDVGFLKTSDAPDAEGGFAAGAIEVQQRARRRGIASQLYTEAARRYEGPRRGTTVKLEPDGYWLVRGLPEELKDPLAAERDTLEAEETYGTQRLEQWRAEQAEQLQRLQARAASAAGRLPGRQAEDVGPGVRRPAETTGGRGPRYSIVANPLIQESATRKAVRERLSGVRERFTQELDPIGEMQREATGANWQPGMEVDPFHVAQARRSMETEAQEQFFTRFVEPILTLAKQGKVSIEEIDAVLLLRHIPERDLVMKERNYTNVRTLLEKQRDRLSGKEKAAKQQEIDALDAREQTGEFDHLSGYKPAEVDDLKRIVAAKQDILDRIHQLYLRMKDERERLMVKYGLVSQETIDTLKSAYPNYVPIKDAEQGVDFMDAFFGINPKERKRVGARKAYMPALGRKTSVPLGTIFEQAVSDTSSVIRKGEKSKVEIAILKFAQEHKDVKTPEGKPLLQIIKAPTERYFDPDTGAVRERVNNRKRLEEGFLPVRYNGQQWYVKINNDRVMNALATLDAKDAGVGWKTIGWASRAFSGFQTRWNFLFPLLNYPRDVQTAFLRLFSKQIGGVDISKIKHRHREFAKYVSSYALLKDTKTWKSWTDRYHAAGGRIGVFSESNPDALHKSVKRRLAGVKDPAQWLPKFFTTLGDVIEAWNSLFELASRVAVFRMAIEAGLPEEQAAFLGRNITVDFNQRGRAGQTFLKMYAFANANLQGAEQMVRAIGEGNPKVVAFVSSMVASAIAYSVMMEQILGNDPDEPDKKMWDQIPWDVKERFILIPLGEGRFAKWPLPYGFNMFWILGLVAHDVTRGRMHPMDAAFRTVATVLGPFNPLGNVGLKESWWNSVGTGLTPTALRPVYEALINEDWRGQPIAPEDFIREPYQTSRSAKYWPSSEGTPVQEFTEWLNKIGGGDKTAPGRRFGRASEVFDVNPETLSYMFGSFFGGTARNLAKIGNVAIGMVGKKDLKYWDYPLVPSFYQERPTWILNQHFNTYVGELEMHHDRYTRLKREDPAAAESYAALWGPYLRMYPQIRQYREALKKAPNEERKREIRKKFVALYAKAQQELGGD